MPVAPEKEADRVAPVSLVSLAEPVVTTAVAVAVWPPEVPPPDSLHFSNLITIEVALLVELPPFMLKNPLPTFVPDVGFSLVP